MAVSRRRAGERVHSMMQDLSDGLIAHEDDAKGHMEALFTGGLGPVAALVADLHGKSHRRSVDEVAGKVRDAAQNMVTATQGPFKSLVEAAVAAGLDSIREELLHCESTLAPKYTGVAHLACDAVDEAHGQLVSLAMVQYASNAVTVLTWFTAQLESELLSSLNLMEPVELLLGRVISPLPVQAPGHVGRGLWWKVLEHCNRITREVEFATVNAARTEAMNQFNRIGEGRK